MLGLAYADAALVSPSVVSELGRALGVLHLYSSVGWVCAGRLAGLAAHQLRSCQSALVAKRKPFC